MLLDVYEQLFLAFTIEHFYTILFCKYNPACRSPAEKRCLSINVFRFTEKRCHHNHSANI